MRARLGILTVIVAAAVMAVFFVTRGEDKAQRELAGPPVPPPKAADSPLHGVPLPEGAVPDAEAARPETEVFRVHSKVNRFGDVDEFYRREMEGRPFRDLAWCGLTTDDRRLNVIRVWTQQGGNVTLTVALKQEAGSGPRITVARGSGARPACPPAPLDRE